MKPIRLPLAGRRLVAVALAFLAMSPLAEMVRAEGYVAVVTSAADSYLQQRVQDGHSKPETYVFMQGSFRPTLMRDRGLERASFADIAKRLAQDLRTQSFYPAKRVAEADLLLVVHWGGTSPRQSTDEMMAHTGNEHQQLITEYDTAKTAVDAAIVSGGTPSDVFSLEGRMHAAADEVDNDTLLMAHEASDATMGIASSARLLGLSGELERENRKLWDSAEAQTLRSILAEERYFIVIVAYDCQELLKTKKLRRVWSTKLNMRSPGTNFAGALDRMSQVGGSFFGRQQDGMAFEHPPEKRANVEIGKLIVIESVPVKR